MSKRVEIREQRRRDEIRKKAIGYGALALLLVSIIALVYFLTRPAGQVAASEVAKPEAKTYPDAAQNMLGKADAPVKVVEYADYLCSHCQEYALKQEGPFIEQYVTTGQVSYEYRPVALQSPNDTESIEATYCAGDQDAFWPYKDMVYTNIVKSQSTVVLGSSYLTAYAEALKLNTNEFNQCMSSNKYANKASENLAKAREANIPGTPTFIVNGVQTSRLELGNVVAAELAKVQ